MSQPTNDMPPFQIFTDFTIFAGRFRFNFVDSDSNLGEGSYGEVVKGWDNEWDQENENDKRTSGWVAIKRSFSANDQSIKREYEVAKDLGNDQGNVMRYLAYGRLAAPHVGVRDYLVMPYYPDGNLHQFIRYNALTTTQIHNLARGILSGLALLHHHKRQHRDLKGSNILVGRDTQTNEVVPVIADFGSAKLVTQSNSESFSQSEHAKTIANAAPEQILGESCVNYNVDLWAFGVILYEIMTGQHPFNYGLDELEPTTARSTLTKRIVTAALPEKTKKIAEPYQTMIRRCLVVDRKKRVQKAEELLKVLNTFKVPEPGTDPVVEATEVERKNKSDWTLLGIFGLILLILFFYILTKSQTTTDDSLPTADSTATQQSIIVFKDIGDFSEGLASINVDSNTRSRLFSNEGKWGFIDKKGQVVIEPQFEEVGGFRDGLAWVKTNGKIGYINMTGQVAIAPQFDPGSWGTGHSFENGFAQIKLNGKWGFINKKGQVVIKPQFDDEGDFKEGLAWVKTNGKIGYINMTGQLVIAPQFDPSILGEGSDFEEGLASAGVDGMWGSINRSAKFIFDNKFPLISSFDGGLAYVITLLNEKGYIDKTGNLVIGPAKDIDLSIYDGFVSFKKDGKYGFMNKSGYIVVEPKFDDVSFFSEGMAGVKIKDKWGFINEKGEIVIDPEFSSIEGFHQGLSSVQINKKYGVIDKTGHFVINPTYQYIEYFREGKAFFQMNEKWGVIDTKGHVIITPKFDDRFVFYEGLASATMNNRDVVINKQGQCVINCP